MQLCCFSGVSGGAEFDARGEIPYLRIESCDGGRLLLSLFGFRGGGGCINLHAGDLRDGLGDVREVVEDLLARF